MNKTNQILARKNKAAVNLKTGRFDNINLAVSSAVYARQYKTVPKKKNLFFPVQDSFVLPCIHC